MAILALGAVLKWFFGVRESWWFGLVELSFAGTIFGMATGV